MAILEGAGSTEIPMSEAMLIPKHRSLHGRTRHPYYILAPDFSHHSAGVRCLHQLCHALNEAGEEAYLVLASTASPHLRTPLLTRDAVRDHYISGVYPIAVYPEVYSGNPLHLPAVARWLMNIPGHLCDGPVFSGKDVVFAYDKWCIPAGMQADLLSLPTTNTQIFNNENNPNDDRRSTRCYYAHKALAFGQKIHPEHAALTSLCHDIPRTPQEIAKILRNSEVLYCYEQSSIIHEALACGCPVLLVSSDYWQVENSTREILFMRFDGVLEDIHGHTSYNQLVEAASPNSTSNDACAVFHEKSHIFIHPDGVFNLGISDLTIEAWVFFNDSTVCADQTFLCNDFANWGVNSWLFGKRKSEQGRVAFCIANAGTEVTLADSSLPPEGQWIHYSVVRHHATFNLYRDGNCIASSEFKGPINTNGSGLVIGAAPDRKAGTDCFCGYLREIRISKGKVRYASDFFPEIGAAALPTTADIPLLSTPGISLASEADGLEWAKVTAPFSRIAYEEWYSYAWEQIVCFIDRTQTFARKLVFEGIRSEDLSKESPLSNFWLVSRQARESFLDLFLDVIDRSTLYNHQFRKVDSDRELLSWMHSKIHEHQERIRTTENSLLPEETLNLLDEIKQRTKAKLGSSTEDVAVAQSTQFAREKFEYDKWLSAHELQPIDAQYLQEHVNKLWKQHPLFEFMLVLRPGHEAFLADTIDSLAAQFFNGWRLSIFAHTPSPDPEFNNDKSTVRWIEVEQENALADAINHKLLRSSASWIGFFACGTQFPQQALLVCGDYIATHPQWRLIYTDDDAISADGLRQSPQFKPDFNPDLLRSIDYIGSFFVERSALIKAGGYANRPGSERYDIALRILDGSGESAIGHIPDVLSHIPVAVEPRANDEAALLSLREHFERRQITAEIHPGLIPGQSRRIKYLHATTPKVSIIIPCRNRLDLLGPCIESLLSRTRYPDWELLIVDNDSDEPNVPAYYQALSSALAGRVRILGHSGDFNFAAMNNRAAEAAHGDYLLLLNNDTEIVNDDWLDVLMSHAQRPEIGVVGARLLKPDGQELQHAGLVLGMNGTAGAVFAATQSPEEPGYMLRAHVEQNYSAVSGACLLIRKSIYQAVNGMDEESFRISNSDVDLCLKIRRLGYRVLWTPHATLIHHGSASLAAADAKTKEQRAPRLQHEAHQMAKRWLPELANDPAWNRNLSLSSRHPVTESELVVPWNLDFRDRPRLLWMPLGSPGQAEYRTFAPMRALHENGLAQCAAVCQPKPGHPDRTPTPVELARLAPDALIMHAPVDNVRCIGLLHYKEINADILRIYSLDDLITDIPTGSHVYKKLPSAAMRERLGLGLAASDRLIVSTEPLAELCRNLIGDIRLLPNTLEWSTWGALQSTRRRGSKLRVGWAGAQQHAGDLQFMLDVVKATHTEVDWIFFGMMPNGAQPYVAEFHEFVHRFADYPAKLASLDLDLAVAPLEIHPFNEAKSNLRLLEYGILGWPVICTDIVPYQTDAAPVTRLPNDAGKWIAAIRERIGEPDALAREGDTLREWVKRGYLLENNLERWLQALIR